MTTETNRMVSTLSGHPIPFLIPVIITVILLLKHPIEWKSLNFIRLLLVFVVWLLAIIIKYADFTTQFFSYMFFLFYALIVAFIHIKVFGEQLFSLYETIIVLFAKISLLLWLFSIILPNIASTFFHYFPETEFGNNFIYIYNWMDPIKGQYYEGLMRNAGLSWEPGRYAIMLCLAILFNLYRNGIKFRANSNIIYMLLALVTTQSTTGYVIVIILYLSFYLSNISWLAVLKTIALGIPIIVGLMQLDFMYAKIADRMNIKAANDAFFESEEYYSRHKGRDDHIALDRFQSLYFEWQNFLNDPFLGSSTDSTKSYFAKTFISDYSLTGGLLKIYSQFGIFLAIFIYILLFISSFVISKHYNCNNKYILAISFILFSIAYPIFGIPIFTTFWLYGFLK